ncbi:MAG: YihA family ribosome biogenesis GTP-binding protein [Lewinellaceae bacterium]|nr:YihA family ribosome biogenesis GTP-binding protein [Lewinella sp.]MCB9278173.1 YihA family ribosome biogenesis GTP-binding protein [Lewinellaceae bacterium]
MEIEKAEFIGSFPDLKHCPKSGWPEFAFIGRSNVGKSSLINMLCGRKELAHTSGKPGKTQSLNYFAIDEKWYLVDLPGYGYARISKTKRADFGRLIESYLRDRRELVCAFLLLDINVPPQALDMEFMNWMGENQVPFVVAFTKTDKLSPVKIKGQAEAICSAMLENWETLPEQFVTSSHKKTGRQEILQFIGGVLQGI